MPPPSTTTRSAPTVTLDAASETATLSFPQPLAVGAHRLRIGFTARINSFARGLFFVDYPTDNGTKRMLSSQLEPADARRIFPCWDEPAFKATFALTVTVPRQFSRGQQHAGRARAAGGAEPEAGDVRTDAENVELPVRARGRRTRAVDGASRRHHGRRGHHRRQSASTGVLRSTTRSSCWAITTIISA